MHAVMSGGPDGKLYKAVDLIGIQEYHSKIRVRTLSTSNSKSVVPL